MFETFHTINKYGGHDYTYRVRCDCCGKYISVPATRGVPSQPKVFIDNAEAQLTAMYADWQLNGKRAVCPKCAEELAEKGLKP